MKRSKYGNTWCTHADGTKFQSKAEMRRYCELLLLVESGVISYLELQPVFVLHAFRYSVEPPHPPTTATQIGKYKADFSYCRVDRWNSYSIEVVEDVKGMKTALYKWKKKHVEAQYGITITEIVYK